MSKRRAQRICLKRRPNGVRAWTRGERGGRSRRTVWAPGHNERRSIAPRLRESREAAGLKAERSVLSRRLRALGCRRFCRRRIAQGDACSNGLFRAPSMGPVLGLFPAWPSRSSRSGGAAVPADRRAALWPPRIWQRAIRAPLVPPPQASFGRAMENRQTISSKSPRRSIRDRRPLRDPCLSPRPMRLATQHPPIRSKWTSRSNLSAASTSLRAARSALDPLEASQQMKPKTAALTSINSESSDVSPFLVARPELASTSAPCRSADGVRRARRRRLESQALPRLSRRERET